MIITDPRIYIIGRIFNVKYALSEEKIKKPKSSHT